MISRTRQQGAMVIETAIVLPVFLFIIFSALELGRGLMIRASLDHVVAEAARNVKLTAASGANFQQSLHAAIRGQSASLLDADKLKVTDLQSFGSPQALAANTGHSGSASLNAPLVRYHVSYDMNSISPWLEQLNFSTEIIVKHEN